MEENIQELELEERLLTLEHDALGHKLKTLRSKLFLLKHFHQDKTVTTEPGNYSNSKSEATPEQTATGKELTNPLTTVALPKSKEAIIASTKETPLVSSKIADLFALAFISRKFTPLVNSKSSPLEDNKDSPLESRRLAPNYKTAVEKDINTAYYVIYDGPHHGIYTNWGEVSSYTNGTDYAFKKFNTLDQARKSAQNFDIKRNTGMT